MQDQEIRNNWIKFFSEKKKHLSLPSASLVPQNPTLLLTNAGMVPFVPYFLGHEKPPASRIVTVQKCVRLGGKDSDLENIGKTSRHLTFFEMMGNFSFGDYFKEEIIVWAWELLTEVYGFDKDELIVSIFAGDEKVGEDKEAFDIWHKKIGLSSERIIKMGRADNFWGPPGGISGPCGPCSEIYYAPKDGSEPIEIWNLVFMQYEQLESGVLQNLPKPNVDTGAGLERLATILQKKQSVFETDLMSPLIKVVKNINLNNINDLSPEKTDLSFKIIADHVRCSSFLIADGVIPSNVGRGYLLRMLIRRAARFGYLLGFKKPFLNSLMPALHEIFDIAYPEIKVNHKLIESQILSEEEAFQTSIERGLKRFNDLINNLDHYIISGEQAFDLYATYGFPLELTIDLAEEKNLKVDLAGYEKAKIEHSEISNQGKFAVGFKAFDNTNIDTLENTKFIGYESLISEDCKILGQGKDKDEYYIILDQTPFYAESGGQLSDKGIIADLNNEVVFEVENVQKQLGKLFIHRGKFLVGQGFEIGQKVKAKINPKRRTELGKHHTATHLLQSALRQVLGSEIKQTGSLVDFNKFRFDFSYPKALTEAQIQEVGDFVNSWIKLSLPVKTKIMSFDQAVEEGALAFFCDKYDQEVRVLNIGNEAEKPVSIELCGGTHVFNTSEIEGLKIISETAVSAGNRRIEALVGQGLWDYLSHKADLIDTASKNLKVKPIDLAARIKNLQDDLKTAERQIVDLQSQLLEFQAKELLNQVKTHKINSNHKYLISKVEFTQLKEVLDYLGNKLQKDYSLILISQSAGKAIYAAKVSEPIPNLTAKDLVQKMATISGGSGGGRPDYAQGGGGNIDKINLVLESLNECFDLK